MTDAHQYMHGKKFAVYGDPDYLLGYVSFLLEMGATPYHILCSKGTKKLEKELQALLDASPYGKGATIYMNSDLWHLRSLLMTDPVDAMIGDTHGKFAARDAKIPLFRFGFPIFDRVNLHRIPLVGYQGVINMVTDDLQQVHRSQGRDLRGALLRDDEVVSRDGDGDCGTGKGGCS